MTSSTVDHCKENLSCWAWPALDSISRRITLLETAAVRRSRRRPLVQCRASFHRVKQTKTPKSKYPNKQNALVAGRRANSAGIRHSPDAGGPSSCYGERHLDADNEPGELLVTRPDVWCRPATTNRRRAIHKIKRNSPLEADSLSD